MHQPEPADRSSWMPLDRHTGPLPPLPVPKLHWRAPAQAEALDFFKDSELLLREQAEALQRNMTDHNNINQIKFATHQDLLEVYERIKSLAIEEHEDAAAVTSIEELVVRATHQLEMLERERAASEQRLSTLRADNAVLADAIKNLPS
jgi:hypothetical protein